MSQPNVKGIQCLQEELFWRSIQIQSTKDAIDDFISLPSMQNSRTLPNASEAFKHVGYIWGNAKEQLYPDPQIHHRSNQTFAWQLDCSTMFSINRPLRGVRIDTIDCNWDCIVSRAVSENGKQSSVFLQKLVANSVQKYDIVDAVITQAFPVMMHRAGNFLAQCCFEHASPGQIIKLAKVVRDNILDLATDAFGSHVVQKAVNCVPENYKVAIVDGLLLHIDTTIIHPNAFHVWMRLLAAQGVISSRIMNSFNTYVRGIWHEIAVDRFGSVLVQTIFEDCSEEDKRPCIDDIFANIDVVAHGRYGSWCITHLCKHGTVEDRRRATDHIIQYAFAYSTGQFSSKIVRNCLGSAEFRTRYLNKICQNPSDSSCVSIVDIACDQYGSSLIQDIIKSHPEHREPITHHIHNYGVSLCGSKFGIQLFKLCTNTAISNYPVQGSIANYY